LGCLERVADGGDADTMLQFRLERGGDGTKRYRKMKRRQGTHLDSTGRKRDTTRRRGDDGQRRGSTGEERGRRQYQLD
jgi:hypothetical protein